MLKHDRPHLYNFFTRHFIKKLSSVQRRPRSFVPLDISVNYQYFWNSFSFIYPNYICQKKCPIVYFVLWVPDSRDHVSKNSRQMAYTVYDNIFHHIACLTIKSFTLAAVPCYESLLEKNENILIYGNFNGNGTSPLYKPSALTYRWNGILGTTIQHFLWNCHVNWYTVFLRTLNYPSQVIPRSIIASWTRSFASTFRKTRARAYNSTSRRVLSAAFLHAYDISKID